MPSDPTDPTPVLARLRELHEAATPGPWTAYRMVHAERGGDMSADEMGEYVRNSVLKSASEGGGPAFLAVLAQKDDGSADVCHVGNGPTSPANAKAIEAMHASHAALLAVAEAAQMRVGRGHNDTCSRELGDEYACDCGQEETVTALTALAQVKS